MIDASASKSSAMMPPARRVRDLRYVTNVITWFKYLKYWPSDIPFPAFGLFRFGIEAAEKMAIFWEKMVGTHGATQFLMKLDLRRVESAKGKICLANRVLGSLSVDLTLVEIFLP